MKFFEKGRRNLSVEEGMEKYWNEFIKEIGIATDLLTIVEIKEIREEIRSMRLLAILRDEIGPFRRAIKEFTDKVYDTSLPLILVYPVSSLENFLRRIWLLKIGPINRRQWKIFSNPKKFAKEIKKRFNASLGDITFRVNAVFIKRHIILHRNREIDKAALEVFREVGISDVHKGEKLELTAADVTKDIETLRNFAYKVKGVFQEAPNETSQKVV